MMLWDVYDCKIVNILKTNKDDGVLLDSCLVSDWSECSTITKGVLSKIGGTGEYFIMSFA